MASTVTVESAIRTELIGRGPCTLDVLLHRLPQFSWSEVFSTIDQLSRDGGLVLRHPTRFDYEVSIGPAQPASERVSSGCNAADDALSGHVVPNLRPARSEFTSDPFSMPGADSRGRAA
jgi:hypothetical protein